jgi:hypothetical protein
VKRWLVLASVSMLAACEPAERPSERFPDNKGAGRVISRVTEEGPIKMTVALTPAEPRLGDPLSLTLTVEARPDVTVEMPAFGEALGRFSILDFTPRQQTRADGGTLASHRYTLQAPMSGKQRIPPLRIEYLDARPARADQDDPYRELLSEELTVEIASVSPEGEIARDLRPPRPPLSDVKTGIARLWPWLFAGAAAIVGLGWALSAWRRRAAARIRLTAYDRAIRRLAKLERQGLPSTESADAWYVELSDIVRRYIEDQYGVRAPELTTEEFLQEAQRSADLSGAHRTLLSAFLERCDRVKFAAYNPDQSESSESLSLARRFLGERPMVTQPGLEPAL